MGISGKYQSELYSYVGKMCIRDSIMVVPINAMERSKVLQEVVCTKKIQQWVILLIRLIMSLICLLYTSIEMH